MVPLQVEEKLHMFQEEKYVALKKGEHKVLKEKSESGKVRLAYTALGETLILLSPEQNVLPYLDGRKQGARSCADVIIYRWKEGDKVWDLHIIEFKKTINTSTLGKAKWQFTMGIYNARAIAAFLGIGLGSIYLYSGFRNDTLSSMESASLITLRISNNSEKLKEIRQWKEEECELRLDGENKILPHYKILLNQDGDGILSI